MSRFRLCNPQRPTFRNASESISCIYTPIYIYIFISKRQPTSIRNPFGRPFPRSQHGIIQKSKILHKSSPCPAQCASAKIIIIAPSLSAAPHPRPAGARRSDQICFSSSYLVREEIFYYRDTWSPSIMPVYLQV